MHKNKNLSPKLIESAVIKNFLINSYRLEVTEIQRIERGVESGAWLINSKKGKFYVKTFGLNELPLDRVEEELQLYELLNKNNIRTPIVFPDMQNNKLSKLTKNNNTYPVVLMKYEELRRVYPKDITKEEIYKIMQSIAKMHKVLEDYAGKYSNQPGDIMNIFKWNFYKHFLSSPNSSSFTKEELKKIKNIDDKITNYLNNNYPPKPKIYSIIHSDLALEHIQFLENGEVYIFDFADRCFGPVAFELAAFLTHAYRENNITFERWEEIKAWAVEGYQSITPLSKADLASLMPFIIRRIQGEI